MTVEQDCGSSGLVDRCGGLVVGVHGCTCLLCCCNPLRLGRVGFSQGLFQANGESLRSAEVGPLFFRFRSEFCDILASEILELHGLLLERLGTLGTTQWFLAI